jgi:uncharacterized protein YecE (DUF72 family)
MSRSDSVSVFRTGTSGFSYQDWKGPFYPRGIHDRDMLAFYAERFPMVEINSSYYRIPSVKAVRSMVAKVPEDFEFVVKAHGSITHERRPPDRSIPPFLEALEPMVDASMLGCLLFQFPNSFRHSPDNTLFLQGLREALPREWPSAIEFRHSSWLRGSVYEALTAMGLGFANCDMPRVRGLMPPTDVVTSDIAYVRLHGRNAGAWYDHDEAWERYDYLYTDQELAEWVPRLLDIARRANKAYVVFNNHPRGNSAQNADTMRRKLVEADPGSDFTTGLELAREQRSLDGF